MAPHQVTIDDLSTTSYTTAEMMVCTGKAGQFWCTGREMSSQLITFLSSYGIKVGFMMIDRARALPVPVRVCGTAFHSFGGRWNELCFLSFIHLILLIPFFSFSYPFLILLILSTNLTFYTLKLSANVFFTLPCLGHVYFPFTQCREPHAKAKPAVGRIPTQIYLNLRSTLRLLALLTSHSVTTQTIQNIHTSLPAETSSRK